MTCHLSKTAAIVNIQAVKSSLNFDNEPEDDPYSAKSWESVWDDNAFESARLRFEDHQWLQKSLISVSPALDVLAIANWQHAVFLTSKYDGYEQSDTKLKFSPSFEGKLSIEKDETVTNILCLPLASQKRSLQGGPDWTCVIVGFSSGYVRIYTEKAELLLSQLLHEEPVSHLKCKTFSHQHFPNASDQPEEVIIAYTTVIVAIDGFGLFQTLRACRNQLARATAGKHEMSQPPPLSYKKFGVNRFSDCEAAGTVGVSAFDHLVTESIRRGFYGAVKPTVPTCSLLVTGGTNPYVGFYHASEVASQLLLTDVVHAVASKLMSFITHSNAGGLIGGLIGRGDSAQPKDKPKIEPPANLPIRFGLYDKRRQGLSLVLSPNKSLIVVSDGFGRVILFDALKGVAVRMWKGYRDAQCGWVEVEDDVQQKDAFALSMEKKKRAFFLVIYAPRRGILEVWCSQQGPRVAAFNVGKSGRLIYPGYSMVGAGFASNMMLTQLATCYFLDVDGLLKKVIVPFHLTLSERNSKHVRDLHLLKEFRLSVRSNFKGKAIEMVKILQDMRTANIRLQALESLFSSHHCNEELVETVVSGLLSHLEKQDPSETDYKMKQLKQSCVRANQLVKLYTTMNDVNGMAAPAPSSNADDIDIQLYASTFCISETEAGRILSYVKLHQTVVSSLKKQVRFLDDNVTDLAFSDFLSFFNVTDSPLQKLGEEIVMKNLIVDLKSNLTEKQLESLGGYLFHTSIYVGGHHSRLQTALAESGMLPEKLLHLLLCHWIANSEFCEDPQKWLNLQQAMKQISSLSDPKLVSVATEEISLWWKAVRDVLQQSTSNIAAYICAVIARSVSIVMAAAFRAEMQNAAGDSKKLESGEALENGDSDWESVSLDLEHWNLLVKQLEDVLLLSILLKSQPYGKVIVRDVNISLMSLLNGGQGTVTDLVAVWAVCVGLQPELLSSFFMSDNDEDLSVSQKCLQENKPDIPTLYMIKGIINELRRKFPYSLNHDVLLANCSWEHLMQWNRNKDVVDHLKQSLSCFDLIRSSVIKHGFATMMWKSCIQSKFEALALLVEKVGKTPKERLCRKELEMNDTRLEDFIDYCCKLLNIILETSMMAELEEVPKYQCEELWQDRENHGPTPLILMALSQKISNNTTAYLHLMLSIMLHLVVAFQLKNSRPIGLFGPNMKKALFRELHYHAKTTSENEDSSLQSTRQQFLLRVLSAVAQSITETVPETPSLPLAVGTPTEDPPTVISYGLKAQQTASKWLNKVIDLGRDWDLNLDELRRQYVCELYSCGHDTIAEQVASSVTDKTRLASQLLLIAGQRVYKLIYDSSDPASKLGFLSPDLSAWLKTLEDRKLRCYSIPLKATVNLTNNVVAYLPEGSREQLLAVTLQDTVKGMSFASGDSNS